MNQVTTPLIPLELFFAHPDYSDVRISPDGRTVSFLRPWQGVLNLWVQDLETGETRRVTADQGRGILAYDWAYNGDLLYIQDKDGDENWRIYAVSPQGGE
ncbi:MAG: S9 family peptidase, partial [Chloroflexi bacterium]|nr:S9 family peptidase [Chloroflexota bacterium]